MPDDGRHLPLYDAYFTEKDFPERVYVGRLNLVLSGDRVFLADNTNHSDVVDDIHRLDSDAVRNGVVIHALKRDEAIAFASFIDWDAVCDALPDDHPIGAVPIPYMEAFELDPNDPRLESFDLEAIRTSDRARTDQARARIRQSPYVSDEPEVPDAELPPL